MASEFGENWVAATANRPVRSKATSPIAHWVAGSSHVASKRYVAFASVEGENDDGTGLARYQEALAVRVEGQAVAPAIIASPTKVMDSPASGASGQSITPYRGLPPDASHRESGGDYHRKVLPV